MALIRLDKQYDNLYAFGCSFTTGHHLGKKASWATFLGNKLNCKSEIVARFSGSNYNMMLDLVRICETNDMTNSCVGIQLTERSRREVWVSKNKSYETFNLSTLSLNDAQFLGTEEMRFLKKNMDYIETMYFDDTENYIRNIMAIIMMKNYLENKNIDYIFFEGISTINDFENFELSQSPLNYNIFFDKNLIKNIMNDVTFFNKYGPMQPFDRTHELFDEDENSGHPNIKFVEWWVDEMYEHIKNNQ